MSKILYNFWYKVASFLIALVIWTFVQGSENIEKNVVITVSIKVPEGFIVKDGSERHLSATIVGPSAIVEKTQNSDLQANINLAEVDTGSTEIEVDTTDISDLDSRLKVTIKNPSISLFIDKKIKKQVPIREILQGYVSPGFKVESVQIDPQILTIEGAKSELENIQFVQTDPIDISGLEATTTKNVFLVKSTSLSVIYSVKKVNVSIVVATNSSTQVIKEVPVHIQSLKYSQKQIDLEPLQVDVEIEGDLSKIADLPSSQILNAVVVLPDTKFDAMEQDVQVYPLVDGIKVLRVIPQKVLVGLKK